MILGTMMTIATTEDRRRTGVRERSDTGGDDSNVDRLGLGRASEVFDGVCARRQDEGHQEERNDDTMSA